MIEKFDSSPTNDLREAAQLAPGAASQVAAAAITRVMRLERAVAAVSNPISTTRVLRRTASPALVHDLVFIKRAFQRLPVQIMVGVENQHLIYAAEDLVAYFEAAIW